MKRTSILLVFLTFFVTLGFGQNQLKEHFKNDLENYTNAFNNKDWDVVAQMMYPRIFDLVSRETAVAALKQMDNLGVSMTSDLQSVDRISDIVENDNEKYCKIYYSGIIKVELSGLMSQGGSLMQTQFEEEFGKENVMYDKESNLFIIHANRSMMAIANKNSNNWKYIDVGSFKTEYLKKLIPDEVHQQLIN